MSIPQQGGGPIERRDQLAAYIASGEKPREAWRIGTEHEKFGFLWDTLEPLPYDGERSIRAMLEGMRDRFGWAEVREGGKLIGLSREGANVSLEPGGQFELSGAPVETIHETCAETVQHLAEVAEIAEPMNAGFMGIGAAPIWRQDQMPMMPKGRYALMTPYMQKVGTLGTQMMYRTSTVQVNLDFASEADMVQKLRVALALQPFATALFANSPFLDGRPNGMKSWRSHIWQNLDAARTGMLPFVFEDGFGYEAWVEYVLDVPMYFVYRDGRYIDALGMSFRDFMEGRLPALPGELPTLSDWADHMTTVFPEARVKKYIEMRGADCGPLSHLCALPALWVGLCYDQAALDGATELTRGWTHETREGLRRAAARDGLAGEHDGLRLNDLAREVLALAEAGLAARARPSAEGAPDEVAHLAVLRDRVERGITGADDLLAAYHGEWQGDLTRIYAATAY
ncbi:glutamate--cysteine ligase [Paracoccus sanguinis]|uniref:Glutamate--cysteine ligase n=1 Tax=Paracoccus sanguinis TaxID=1545044 RepID=A0A1H2X409_9RHOB|nr:glutamate--cysteine ligase [Paracoccus sanguinis]KGJ17397.1 glutamate--cysteine ligase [Paracoccus sanguinis]SDW87521.1 glutamate--cysteine ligase [Paracoccus sanguinis]